MKQHPPQEATQPRDLNALASEIQALTVRARNALNGVLRELETAATALGAAARKETTGAIPLRMGDTEKVTGKIAANYVNKLLDNYTKDQDLEDKPTTGKLQKRSGPPSVQAAGTPDEKTRSGLYGDGKTISVPDVLSFLSSALKSGVFEVQSADENFLIELKGGDVVHATGDRPPNGMRLGDILVSQGFVERPRIEALLKKGTGNTEKLGSTLLRQKVITEQELLVALSFQVQHLFNRLFSAKEARYSFREGAHLVQTDGVRVNVMQLLLESARLKDEEGAPEPVWTGSELFQSLKSGKLDLAEAAQLSFSDGDSLDLSSADELDLSDSDEIEMDPPEESEPAPDLMDSWMTNLHDPMD